MSVISRGCSPKRHSRDSIDIKCEWLPRDATFQKRFSKKKKKKIIISDSLLTVCSLFSVFLLSLHVHLCHLLIRVVGLQQYSNRSELALPDYPSQWNHSLCSPMTALGNKPHRHYGTLHSLIGSN